MKIINIIGLLVVTTIFACSSANDSYLEKYNKSMYSINKKIDNVTLKPIAKGYKYITPAPIVKSTSNFFSNLGEINTLTNSLLQGKLNKAGLSSSRIVWNTTLGLGGLFDVATAMGIDVPKEDFGQTLRYWGVPAGPFIILPILGPSTVTDSIGMVSDNYINPMSNWNWNDYRTKAGKILLNTIDTRTKLLLLTDILESSSTNEYDFVKDSYMQKRNYQTRYGELDESLEDDIDALFEDDIDALFEDDIDALFEDDD